MARTRLYHPNIKVTLHKTIKRKMIAGGTPASTRFQGIDKEIDLTPYLCESSGVRVSKSVQDPAGGFSVTLGDKPNKGLLGFETMYGLIEPMDFIEIRMRHGVGVGLPPVVMRGFVSSIGRSESIGADGKPARTVSISGQDYGKLWQMLQILFLPGYIVGEDTLTSFKLFERFGVGFKTGQSGADFLKEVVEKVLNPYVKKLMPENTGNPKEFKLDRVVAKHGTTSVSGVSNQEGTIYNLLRVYLDVGVWNELFVEDEDDGVYIVYRPNPYKSVAGKKIQDDAPDVKVVDLPGDDILSFNVERTDADVANYYWVHGARFDLNTEVYRKQLTATGEDRKTVVLDTYENSSSQLYGIRAMFVETMMGGDDVTSFTPGLPENDQKKRDTSIANWLNDRRRILVEQNKDNVVLEHGMIRIRGNEEMRAGRFVKVKRGDFSAEYYISRVSHDYVPFQGFFTTLQVERGMGFVERAKRGAPASPYLAEMRL
jgi:hypothetical protein